MIFFITWTILFIIAIISTAKNKSEWSIPRLLFWVIPLAIILISITTI